MFANPSDLEVRMDKTNRGACEDALCFLAAARDELGSDASPVLLLRHAKHLAVTEGGVSIREEPTEEQVAPV